MSDGGGQELGSGMPVRAAAAVLLRSGQSGQAEVTETAPELAIESGRFSGVGAARRSRRRPRPSTSPGPGRPGWSWCSSQPQLSRDHAAKDLAGAAADGEPLPAEFGSGPGTLTAVVGRRCQHIRRFDVQLDLSISGSEEFCTGHTRGIHDIRSMTPAGSGPPPATSSPGPWTSAHFPIAVSDHSGGQATRSTRRRWGQRRRRVGGRPTHGPSSGTTRSP